MHILTCYSGQLKTAVTHESLSEGVLAWHAVVFKTQEMETSVLFLALVVQVVQMSLDSGDADAIQPKSLITVLLFQVTKYLNSGQKCKIMQGGNN